MNTKTHLRRIAWASRTASNGLITSWSRWHWVRTIAKGERTICGIKLPNTKWITPPVGDNRGDFRVAGGECSECRKEKENL